jgi:hypothetical protein
VAHNGPRLIPKRSIGGLGVGKTAATRAQLDGWLRIYGRDPAQVVWVVGPDGTQTWDAVDQQWRSVPPPRLGAGED